MTQITVPKYIKNILYYSTLLDEPYRIKIKSKNKVGGEKGFEKEINKLIEWCKRYYADATIIENGMWYNKYQTASQAYSHGHRNYFILEVTDPIMFLWEKNNFSKNL